MRINDMVRMSLQREAMTKKSSEAQASKGSKVAPNGSVYLEGVDPYMDITGKEPSEWHKIIPVSDAITKDIKAITLEAYMERSGMSGTGATADQHGQASQNYVKTIKGEDRLFATWTLQQISSDYGAEIVETIRKHNPDWEHGQSFDTSILKGFQDDLNKSLDRRA